MDGLVPAIHVFAAGREKSLLHNIGKLVEFAIAVLLAGDRREFGAHVGDTTNDERLPDVWLPLRLRIVIPCEGLQQVQYLRVAHVGPNIRADTSRAFQKGGVETGVNSS